MVFNLRLISKLEFVADCAMWVLRLLPSYPLVNSLYLESASKSLSELRAFTKAEENGTAKFGESNPWSVFNCIGDLAMQML